MTYRDTIFWKNIFFFKFNKRCIYDFYILAKIHSGRINIYQQQRHVLDYGPLPTQADVATREKQRDKGTVVLSSPQSIKSKEEDKKEIERNRECRIIKHWHFS